MPESISVAVAGPLSREDVADLVTDLRRGVDTLTWQHERQEEPGTLGAGPELITAVVEHGFAGVAMFSAGLLLDKVISIVHGWFRARKSVAGVNVDITFTLDGSADVEEVDVAVEDGPANIKVYFARSGQ
jgi:hypothetical protein